MTDAPVQDTSGDIAVVGMAGRFPGARDVPQFWRNLRDGVESITEFGTDELLAAGVSAQDVADPHYVRSAPVLDGVDMFDAGFFGLTPKEAQVTDPQQRLFLEVAWEAFEDAGYDPAKSPDSIGVFAGCAISTYLINNLSGNPGLAGSVSTLQLALGNDKDSLATRVAYALDLRGPSFSVQSYCSTSLVAVATACTSLLSGDCDTALAGGVAISVPHRVGYLYQEGGIASPDGRCRAFDADAMGAPIGNAGAAVVLRRFDDAVADGDHVYAVIKGWAVNNDGSLKAGYPAPGVRGQARVIAEAMANADVDPEDIDYVEAHGTGTSLGDAAEFAALTKAFAGSSGDTAIGSLKTNVGHLDRAAGVTGLIKTALSLRDKVLVPTLHFTRPNPRLDFASSPFHVQTTLESWPDPGRPRLAGVSSFGIGGTNAHVVLAQAPDPVVVPVAGEQVLVLSGRCADSADARVRDLADHLTRHGDDTLADIASTLQSGRRHFACRRAVVVTDTEDASTALSGERVLRHDGTVVDRGTEFRFGERLPASSVAGLYARWPSFAAAVDSCCAELSAPDAEQVRAALTESTLPAHETRTEGASRTREGSTRAREGSTRLGDLVTFVAEYALAEFVVSRSARPNGCWGTGVGAEVARAVSGDVSVGEALKRTAERAWVDSPATRPTSDGENVVLLVGEQADGEASAVRLFTQPDPTVAGTAVLEALAALWVSGVSVDWEPEHDGARRRVSLPTYPFQRRRYWIDPVIEAVASASDPAARRPQEDWLHVPVWRAEPVTADTAEPVGPHLVFADALGVGDLLVGRLAPSAVCVTVLPGNAFARLGPDRYTIRPDHEADYVTLFERLSADGVVPRTVTHLWSVGGHPADGLSADAVRADQVHGFDSVLYLARCLGPAGVDGVRVLVATSGACEVDGSETPAPGRGTLVGLTLTLPQEYPGVACRLVDLETTEPQDRATELFGELGWPGSGTALAFRSGRRLVRRFEQQQVTDQEPAPIARDGGVYLLTGGLGNIGLLIAGHLASQAPCRIVLVGRHGLPPRDTWDSLLSSDGHEDVVRRVRDVLALEEAGAEIVVEAVDIADAHAVTDLVARVLQRFGRLDGVVHSAGRTATDGFTSIEKLDAALVAEHFAPKVYGTLALASALVGRELDFCVLQSSMSSVLGGLGFAAYSAANAFLDAFVPAHNRTTGAAWQVVDWDTWEHVADALADSDLGTTMAANSMSSDEGLATFGRIVRGGAQRLVVSTGDLTRRLEQWAPGSDPLARATTTTSVERFPRPSLIEVCVPPTTRIEHQLVELWQDVLGLEEVGVNDNFFQLGGNSLVVLQLVNRMQRELRTPVEATAVLAAPTISALIERLALAAPTATTIVAAAPVRSDTPHRATGSGSDIAIIGMAGRFPGASTPDEFWRNLRDGVESITRFTDAELLGAGVPTEVSDRADYVPLRPILTGVEDFDAEFFGDTVEHARLVDPQHRIFQECAWEALEDAGYVGQTHPGPIGVFGGSNFGTYLHRLLADPVLGPAVDEQTIALGNDKDGLTTSLSYKLDLRGPSVSVQSFCSTSLVAVHLACRSLRDGECDMAVAGGVSIRVPDRVGQFVETGHDGHVRCFDADGHGLIKGDGAATVVLKRLSDAIADGDTVAAVIRGSAVNNDGAMKGGYDAPSVAGQAEVVAAALRDADVPPATISYVEAHGSSSLIGDQIEVAALTSAFGPTAASGGCALGSAKANVGHLEHASGVTGLIKTVLSLRHRTLPPMPNFRTANPGIDFDRGPFYVNTDLTKWEPADGDVRRAGVSSLGLGGTNAHVVVEEAGAAEPGSPGRRHQILPVSARGETALRMALARLADHLRDEPDISLADVAHTLQVGRVAFEHRATVVCETVADAVRLLDDRTAPRTTCVPGRPVGLVFDGPVPTLDEPEFAAAVERCAQAGAHGSQERLTTFVGQYALAAQLPAWGIRPRSTTGVGVGALVAACVSGELSLEQAIERVAEPSGTQDGPSADPRSALVVCGLATTEHSGDLVVPTVTVDGDVERSLATALAQLWMSGVPVDWAAYHHQERRLRIPLPTYPFQRQRCWFGPDPDAVEASNHRKRIT